MTSENGARCKNPCDLSSECHSFQGSTFECIFWAWATQHPPVHLGIFGWDETQLNPRTGFWVHRIFFSHTPPWPSTVSFFCFFSHPLPTYPLPPTFPAHNFFFFFGDLFILLSLFLFLFSVALFEVFLTYLLFWFCFVLFSFFFLILCFCLRFFLVSLFFWFWFFFCLCVYVLSCVCVAVEEEDKSYKKGKKETKRKTNMKSN